jgi:hypothetical protein
MRLPQVRSTIAVVTGPISAGGWVGGARDNGFLWISNVESPSVGEIGHCSRTTHTVNGIADKFARAARARR